MPELRLVVLALQDRLAYGPTFESAMSALFGNGVSTTSAAPGAPIAAAESPAAAPRSASAPSSAQPRAAPAATDIDALIRSAADDLSEYQRLTAQGRLGEAGSRLEALKQKLERLSQTKTQK